MFVFSQSCAQVSASLPNISGLTVRSFDSVLCSLSVVRLVFVLDVGQQHTSKSSDRFVELVFELKSENWCTRIFTQMGKNRFKCCMIEDEPI